MKYVAQTLAKKLEKRGYFESQSCVIPLLFKGEW